MGGQLRVCPTPHRSSFTCQTRFPDVAEITALGVFEPVVIRCRIHEPDFGDAEMAILAKQFGGTLCTIQLQTEWHHLREFLKCRIRSIQGKDGQSFWQPLLYEFEQGGVYPDCVVMVELWLCAIHLSPQCERIFRDVSQIRSRFRRAPHIRTAEILVKIRNNTPQDVLEFNITGAAARCMTYAAPGPKVGSKMPRAKPGEAACVDLTFVEQLMEKITDGSLGSPGGDSGGDRFGGSDDDRSEGGDGRARDADDSGRDVGNDNDLNYPEQSPVPVDSAANLVVSGAVAAREAARRFDWKRVIGMDGVLWKPCVENDFIETEATREAWFEDAPSYNAEAVPANVELTVSGLKMASQLKGAALYVFEKDYHTSNVFYEVKVKSYCSKDQTHKVEHVSGGYKESLNLFSEWAWIVKEHFK